MTGGLRETMLGMRDRGVCGGQQRSKTSILEEWIRNDPDLQILHGDPEFERLFPP
jgi:hypothetical protein